MHAIVLNYTRRAIFSPINKHKMEEGKKYTDCTDVRMEEKMKPASIFLHS